MLRLYRPFRTVLGSARIASRLQSGQTVRVERVKIKKGKPATRFLGTVLKGALLFQILLWVVPPYAAPQDGDGAGDGDGPNLDDENARFIAFPLTTKVYRSEPYSGKDPEWREFIRISRDPSQTKEIRQHMAGLVLKAALKNPIFTSRIGTKAKVSQYWLDIDYPLRPPPVYERSGLLITDDAIAWATTTCDSWTVKVLDHFLWPKPLALGFWAFGTVAAKQTARDVARYFGFVSEEPPARPSPSSPSSPPPLPSAPGPEVQKALQRIRQEATRRPDEVNDPGSLSSSTNATPTAPSTPRDKAISVPRKPALDQGSNPAGTPEQKPWVEDLISSFGNSQAWKKLKETYHRERRPPRPDPPRGSVFVSGLVQLETPKAYVVCELYGWYDPKTKAHAPGTIHVVFRKMQWKQQYPLRK